MQVKASKRPMCQAVKLAHVVLVPDILPHQICFILLVLNRTATHWYFFSCFFSALESTALPNCFWHLAALSNQLRARASPLRDNIHLRGRTYLWITHWVIVAGCRVGLLTLLLSFSRNKIDTSIDTGRSMAEYFMLCARKPILQPVIVTVHTISSLALARLNVSLRPSCPKLATSSIG